MNWVRIDTGIARSHKIGRLRRALNLTRHEALGVLIELYCWTGSQREDGDLSGLTPLDLADALMWSGPPEELWQALEVAGVIEEEDGAPRVRGWLERQPLLRRRDYDQRNRASTQRVRDEYATSTQRTRDEYLRTDVRTDDTNEEEGAEVAHATLPADLVLTFSGCRSGADGPGGDFHVTEELLATLAGGFPGVDVRRELDGLLGWWNTNPRKRKTLSRMPDFIRRNLRRAKPTTPATRRVQPQSSTRPWTADEVRRGLRHAISAKSERLFGQFMPLARERYATELAEEIRAAEAAMGGE